MKKTLQTSNQAVVLKQEVKPFVHQLQITSAPFSYPERSYFILAGGYGCGKSFSIVLMIILISKKYQGQEISVGVCSTTITLLKKTVILDLERILNKTKSRYEFNQQDNIITIGTVQFLLIATEQPTQIYGPNLNICLCDEIDELPEGKVIEANKALKERTRITLPDGRSPFVMYFTTVQGYRGLYKIVQTLNKAKQKYVLVRGLTKNNTQLDPEYVKGLYAIYDENERLAYLEGRFINLRAGRVYPEFNEETCKVKPFEIGAEYIVQVGQDLNSGFSKACAVIKKDKRLFIVRGWSFEDIGQAPAVMRQTYQEQEILWYPDCSGKEVLKGYKEEIIEWGIECRIGSANPRIIDRVFYVNKLFRLGLLKVFDCKETEIVTEALKTRQYNEQGQPEKGKGEEAPDHICDALEYVIYRIVRSDEDFMDLKELSRENVKENGYLQIANSNRD